MVSVSEYLDRRSFKAGSNKQTVTQ